MPGINANTGRLFSDADVRAGADLRQSVEDRVLTLPGTRRHRPDYGSLATDFSRSTGEVVPSIRRALAGESRITDVSFRTAGGNIEVMVNGSIRMAVDA